MSGPSGAIDADIDTYTHGKNVVEFTPQEEGRLLNPNVTNALSHHYYLIGCGLSLAGSVSAS